MTSFDSQALSLAMTSKRRPSATVPCRKSLGEDVLGACQDSQLKKFPRKPVHDEICCNLSLPRVRERLEIAQGHTKEQFEEYMQHASISFPTDSIQKSIPALRLSWAFVIILEYFQHDHCRAKREIRHALEIARELKDTHSIARCFYWLGRIALCQGKFHKAFYYFETAKPDLDIEISKEAETVDLYLLLCEPNVSQEYRKRLLRDYNQSVADVCSSQENQDDANDAASLRFQNPRKRKREKHDITVVFRSSSQSHPRSNGMKDRQICHKEAPIKSHVPWIIQNTDDTIQYQPAEEVINNNILESSVPTQTPNTASKEHPSSISNSQMSFLPLAREKRNFTFRCYHVGLSGPRARSFELFPLQLGEPDLSIEEGEILQDAMKEKIVTMAYLRRERRFLMERARISGRREAAESKDDKSSLQ